MCQCGRRKGERSEVALIFIAGMGHWGIHVKVKFLITSKYSQINCKDRRITEIKVNRKCNSADI